MFQIRTPHLIPGLLALAATLPAHSEPYALYESVADGPRMLTDNGGNFTVYWGLWRLLSDAERAQIQRNGRRGALQSERTITWTVQNCADGSEIARNSEHAWYSDVIELGADGKVVPSPYAAMPDRLYLVQLNLNGLFLKHQEPFTAPTRENGEHGDEYQKRVSEAYKAYRARQIPRGSRGRVLIESEHRIVTGRAARDSSYRTQSENERDPKLAALMLKLKTDRWPIYFDERVHKSHTFTQPILWDAPTQISRTRLVNAFEWEWCTPTDTMPTVVLKRIEGPAPEYGPSRPGRDPIGDLVPVEQ